MNKVKSNVVKLFVALALALTGAVSVQSINANTNSTQTVQAARKLSAREKAAKRWIASHESGGSYIARNGACYGKYQLNISYLHGDLSPKNQERVADNYVYGRYGSWVNAKAFWLTHHWY